MGFAVDVVVGRVVNVLHSVPVFSQVPHARVGGERIVRTELLARFGGSVEHGELRPFRQLGEFHPEERLAGRVPRVDFERQGVARRVDERDVRARILEHEIVVGEAGYRRLRNPNQDGIVSEGRFTGAKVYTMDRDSFKNNFSRVASRLKSRLHPWGRWGKMRPIRMKPSLHTLRLASGMALEASTLGGIVTRLLVPDRTGKPANVVLSLPDVRDHHDNGYMNALIGRVGNSLSRGGFELDGVFYPVAKNSGAGAKACHLHGGERGFDRHVWTAREFAGADGPALELTTFSPDGEEGYPGNLAVRVVYSLAEAPGGVGAWRIEYWAVSDKPTVVNLTQHAYFNLSGGRRDVAEHRIRVAAGRFTDVDAALLPTGRVPSVAGTALDLREPVRLGDLFAKARKDPLLKRAAGPAPVATFCDPGSGRRMSVRTTEPCMQVYTANFLTPGLRGRGGAVYGPHWACCFETQHAPDSPNRPGFPTIRLNPGCVYHTKTEYVFDLDA